MADFAVFIGRFQPVHAGHVGVVKRALDKHDRVIICLGSSNRVRRPQNPFTAKERKELWQHELRAAKLNQLRVEFIEIDDDLYSDTEWVSQVRHRVNRLVNLVSDSLRIVRKPDFKPVANTPPTVALIGHEKDHTSYYLRFFPEWESDLIHDGYDKFASTTIRNFLYSKLLKHHKLWTDGLYGVSELRGVSMAGPLWSKDFQCVLHQMAQEWDFDRGYDPKKFHVNVLTVDACVVMNGHLLVVRRKNRPGQGLLALPGGHINLNETLENAMLRELREETMIDRSDRVLRSNIQKQQIFDHPDRSSRARVITNAYLIRLPDEDKLPQVEGADDAAEAFWMPLGEVRPQDFFEDHGFLIRKLTAGL